MKLKEITNWLELWAPTALQESYDNCGLLVGEPYTEVGSALLTLDVTEEVIDEAIRGNHQLIIAHHPLIFSGIKKLNGQDEVNRCVIKALRNNIAIYAIHTNIDNLSDGVNKMIADKLGLSDRAILAPKSGQLNKLVTFIPKDYLESVQQALWEAGAGNIGEYSECSFYASGTGTFKGSENTNAFVGEKNVRHAEPEYKMEVIVPNWNINRVMQALRAAHPYEEVAYYLSKLENDAPYGAGMVGILEHPMESTEWLEYLKKQMDLTVIRHTAAPNRTIQKVAICGGAGSFLLNQAIRTGADALVTGDFKYHDFFGAEQRLMICDIGHYESEKYTPTLLRDKLLEKFPTFAAQISSIYTNPINYYY